MSPKPKRLDWESVYHEKLFGINKSTSFLVAAFLLLVYLGFFVLVVLLGTPAQRVPLPVILGIRGVWLASAVVALWLISRDQIKSANNLILAIQILSALSHSLIVADTHSLLNFLGILLSCIIAFQISIILEKRRWFRIYYGFLLFLILLGRGLTLMFNQTTAVDPAVVDIVFLGNFIFLVIIFTGIVASVKRSRMEDIIIQVAYQDDLVDLPNQSSLMTRFNILNRLYWETGNAFALLGVYVDKMDRINYKYGYQAGNQIIKQVAQRLVSLDIPLDVYRIIGPIFVLAPGDFLNVLQVEALYPRIEEVMERPYSINGTQVNLDFSIVATRTPDDGVGINQLLMNILNVISRGNVAGNSHKVNWFDVHSFKQQLRQYEIEDQLEAGLNHDEFFINIQPKIDIRTGQVHGGEVLARWENSNIGFVSPAEFIPAVEATGRMPDFTRRIMEKIVDSKEMIMPVANANKFIIALNLNASTIQDELFIN
ncbi:MAG: EAL domain-containing protein, partial [Spirochaetaceae bacterium]